jgi:hypothetical protein
LVTCYGGIYWGHYLPSPPHYFLTTCSYILRLTADYRATRSSVNRGIYWLFYITRVLAASPDGEPPIQVIQQKIYGNTYSFDTTTHKSMKICSLHMTIHSLDTKFHIVLTQGHNKTYNSITAPRHCLCHLPRSHPCRILSCLEPHQRIHIRLTKKDA